mgnify:FL=1
MAPKVLSRSSTLENQLDSLSLHDDAHPPAPSTAPPAAPHRLSTLAKPSAANKVRPVQHQSTLTSTDTPYSQQLAPIIRPSTSGPSSSTAPSSNIGRTSLLKPQLAPPATARSSTTTGSQYRAVPSSYAPPASSTGLQTKYRPAAPSTATNPPSSASNLRVPGPSSASSSSSAQPSRTGPPPPSASPDIGSYDGGFERDDRGPAQGGAQVLKGEAVKTLALDSSSASGRCVLSPRRHSPSA